MEFKTKYNNGDELYIICKHMTYKAEICKTCDNDPLGVKIRGVNFECPACGGYSSQIEDTVKWEIHKLRSGKVERINIESYTKVFGQHKPLKITYMLSIIGMRNELFWDEDVLFWSFDDAIAECNARNIL